jgi:hypothetical protein
MARTQDTKTAPARLRALATTIYRGMTDDFECNHIGNGIYSVQSTRRADGGITLAGPRIVDVVGDTCTCEGFAHMGICKHIIAALRRAGHHGLVDDNGVSGLFMILDDGVPRTISREDGARAILCFVNMDDALAMERSAQSRIISLDAGAVDRGYGGICLVVGKHSMPIWTDSLEMAA